MAVINSIKSKEYSLYFTQMDPGCLRLRSISKVTDVSQVVFPIVLFECSEGSR